MCAPQELACGKLSGQSLQQEVAAAVLLLSISLRYHRDHQDAEKEKAAIKALLGLFELILGLRMTKKAQTLGCANESLLS